VAWEAAEYIYSARMESVKDSWNNYLHPLSEGLLNVPLLWVLWRAARAPDVTNSVVVILMYTDGIELFGN
jgi:heme A synthase